MFPDKHVPAHLKAFYDLECLWQYNHEFRLKHAEKIYEAARATKIQADDSRLRSIADVANRATDGEWYFLAPNLITTDLMGPVFYRDDSWKLATFKKEEDAIFSACANPKTVSEMAHLLLLCEEVLDTSRTTYLTTEGVLDEIRKFQREE